MDDENKKDGIEDETETGADDAESNMTGDGDTEEEHPDDMANKKILDNEGRKDTHEESEKDPEALNMSMGKNKNMENPNGEIN